MIYKMDLKDSSDTMTFNLLETPIVDKDIEGAVDNVTLDGNQYTDYLYLKKQYIQKWVIMCPDEYDELRGFYTRQFEEGEVPSYRVYYGANVTRDYTLNGDYFQFNAEGIETGMTLSQLLGNAEQTTYSGKNLFDFDKFISDNVSVQGVTRGTATYTSNSITLTATSNDCFTKYNFPTNLYPVIAVSQNTNVTLSWKTSNTSTTNRGVVYVFGNNNGAATVIVNAQDRAGYCTFNTGSYTEISFRVGVANSGDTLTYSDIQVEIGSAPTDYEPYVGGTPAPNPQFPMSISTVTGAQTVVVTGKNLVEDTISGSSIDANGIIRSNSDFDTQVAFVIEGKTYTLSYTGGTVVGGYFATKPTINSVSIDGTRIVNNNKTFVAQYTGYFTFRTDAGESNAQCELGNQSTAYEPYHGQSQIINLGGNLFDRANATENKVLIWSSAEYADENKTIISDYISASEGQQFSSNYIAYIFCYDSSKTYLGTIQIGGTTIAKAGGGIFSTFTIPSGYSVAYIRVEFRSGANSNLDMTQQNIMLNYGSIALPYTPYTTYAYELCKIGTYQDRIYKNDGKWYIEKNVGKLVFDGSETWAASGSVYYTSALASTIIPTPATQHYLGLSDYFEVVGFDYQSGTNLFFHPNKNLQVKNTNWATLDDWKTWLGSHNTTVYYPLATPTTTEITNEALLYQLNFLASLYEGENNISLVGTGAQGEMEVFIRDVMSKETDVVPEVPVRLTLTDDGVINACGCRRNVQLTMRETTE